MGFEDYSEEQYDLLVRKGTYPYEYMSSLGISSQRASSLQRKHSTAISTCLTLAMMITSMHRKFGTHST